MVVQCADGVCNENLDIPLAVSGTRSSARIKQLKIQAEEKKVLRARTVGDSQGPMVNKTKKSNNKRRKLDTPVENAQHRSQHPADADQKNDVGDNAVVQLEENKSLSWKSVPASVTETLRTFNKYYLHFVQEEEKRVGRSEDRKTGKGLKAKGEDAAEGDAKRGSKRPDLKALTEACHSF